MRTSTNGRIPARPGWPSVSPRLDDCTAIVFDCDLVGGAFLGSGTLCNVYRATHKLSGNQVAIKFFKQAAPADYTLRFRRTLEILATTHHPATLRVMGFALSPPATRRERGPVIVTPVMPHGPLKDLLIFERDARAPREWNATTKS
jgi:serine/threonine protein kinase